MKTFESGAPGTVPAGGQLAGCVSVLIPVYNEVAWIQTTISRVLASPVPKEIIVVDDGSTDGTRELLQGLSDIPEFTLVFHKENRGKGAAIRTGLQYARGEYVIIQDADIEYDPRDYPALLEPLRQGVANVVYGVRPDRPERGIHYYLCAKLLTLLANLLYGARIHDEATGYKVFRRSLLAGIPLKCERFEFCPEITAKLCRLGEPIFEVPISYHPRAKYKGSKIGWADGWMAIWTLLRWRFSPRPCSGLKSGPCARKNAAE